MAVRTWAVVGVRMLKYGCRVNASVLAIAAGVAFVVEATVRFGLVQQ